jgi:cell fate regulator YaaT (PSP1 superfamily)
MCCLKYENDEYEAAKKELPDYGKEVITPDGKGKVVGLNLLSRIVKVRLFGRETAVEYDYDEIKEATQKAQAEKGDQNG